MHFAWSIFEAIKYVKDVDSDKQEKISSLSFSVAKLWSFLWEKSNSTYLRCHGNGRLTVNSKSFLRRCFCWRWMKVIISAVSSNQTLKQILLIGDNSWVMKYAYCANLTGAIFNFRTQRSYARVWCGFQKLSQTLLNNFAADSFSMWALELKYNGSN